MAISLGKHKMAGEQQKASREIAAEYAKQQAKESKRKGWSSFLGGVGGKLLGTALAGMTGGLAAPLLMAAGTFGGKALAHEATKGMGADVSKIKKGKYGFGKGEAKTLREGLEEQLRASDPMKQRGGFGRDLLSAYVSAGLEGDMFEKAGSFGKDVKEYGAGDTMARTFGIGGEKLGEKVSTQALIDNPWLADEGGDFWDLAEETIPSGMLEEGEGLFAQGGLVSQSTTPTIADYFGRQGVTLGGSNKQSLSQMLGR